VDARYAVIELRLSALIHEHLHSGGFATTRDQAHRIAVTEDSRVLDVGCGIGGPARYLAHTYGGRVDGIDLTPELMEIVLEFAAHPHSRHSRQRYVLHGKWLNFPLVYMEVFHAG
jgi:cyclopropane fatty-acyl-phospholipid synthase-like methyltransferase